MRSDARTGRPPGRAEKGYPDQAEQADFLHIALLPNVAVPRHGRCPQMVLLPPVSLFLALHFCGRDGLAENTLGCGVANIREGTGVVGVS